MNLKIKERKEVYKVPRYVVIIATRLCMMLQPGRRGSSMYRLPGSKRIPESQRDWKMPVGTLRLSDHWNFKKWNSWSEEYEEEIFVTNISVPDKTWVLAVNTGRSSEPWKVLYIFTIGKGKNIIQGLNCQKIKAEVNWLLQK